MAVQDILKFIGAMAALSGILGFAIATVRNIAHESSGYATFMELMPSSLGWGALASILLVVGLVVYADHKP